MEVDDDDFIDTDPSDDSVDGQRMGHATTEAELALTFPPSSNA